MIQNDSNVDKYLSTHHFLQDYPSNSFETEGKQLPRDQCVPPLHVPIRVLLGVFQNHVGEQDSCQVTEHEKTKKKHKNHQHQVNTLYNLQEKIHQVTILPHGPTPAMYMIRSNSNMAQKSGFKVSSSELTKVRRAPTKRTIHKVFTMRSSRDTRSSRKTRMLELTPVSLLEPRASKMMLTHEKLTTTTSPMGHAMLPRQQKVRLDLHMIDFKPMKATTKHTQKNEKNQNGAKECRLIKT